MKGTMFPDYQPRQLLH